ncbi:hypothetical protein CL656_05045 [bacterium]|nr:hypothetical protein [bacterium]|tara:strand:+ start:423 stop:1373 length:951 start_codon:yes stop_codon:yes gene_type:complete
MKNLNGPVFSIVTPFKNDLSIDYQQLFEYLDYAYSCGARQFYSMAYNTRYAQLTHNEILILNSSIIRHLKKTDQNITVIVGDPIACSTKESHSAAKTYCDLGADLVSILFSERYYSDSQVLEHYSEIAEGLGCGILVHEMPLQCGLGGPEKMWPLSLMKEIVNISEIQAIKEDAKNDEYTQSLAKIVRGKASLILSGGGKRRWLDFGSEVCPAWLNGLGVAYPSYPIKFWELYREGHLDAAKQLISNVEEIFFDKCVSKYGWHLCIRVALHLQGFCNLIERKPLNCLQNKELEEVSLNLSEINNSFEKNNIKTIKR